MIAKIVNLSGLGNNLIFLSTFTDSLSSNQKYNFLFNKKTLDSLEDPIFKIKRLASKLIFLSIISRFRNQIFICNVNIENKILSYFVGLISGHKVFFIPSNYINSNFSRFVKTPEYDLYKSIYAKNFLSFYFRNCLNKEISKNNKFKIKQKYILLHLGSEITLINKRPCSSILSKVFESILNQIKINLIIVGSKCEEKKSNHFYDHIKKNYSNGSNVINLVNKTSLQELALLILDSKFLLAGDSGIRHLADFLKVNNIGLFGPTSEEKVLMKNITHHRKVIRGLNCEAKYRNICKCDKVNGTSKCMLEINPLEIKESILDFIYEK